MPQLLELPEAAISSLLMLISIGLMQILPFSLYGWLGRKVTHPARASQSAEAILKSCLRGMRTFHPSYMGFLV